MSSLGCVAAVAVLAAVADVMPPPFAAAAAGPTVVLRRTADDVNVVPPAPPSDADSGSSPPPPPPCRYDGGYLTLSHPMSLSASDKFFATGQLQLRAMEMMLDEINGPDKCGVTVGGRNYGLTLETFGDDSDREKVGMIARHVAGAANATDSSGEGEASERRRRRRGTSRADFLLGPYSSGLTGVLAPVANSSDLILLAGGAAATGVFASRPSVFGTFPPTKQYLAQAVRGLAEAGATSAVGMWEDASFTRGVCAALPSLAERYGLELKGEYEVPPSPAAEHLDPLARNLSLPELDPDVVVTCVYDKGCAEWVQSMRRSHWNPRAQVFTVCIGMGTFEEAVGNDAAYMMGVSPWDKSLPIEDEITGWSAAEFFDKFYETTQRTATYHAASAAAALGILIQAIERADSLETRDVVPILTQGEFVTLYGTISFDPNGQSQAPALVLQYDHGMDVQTVYPPQQKSGELLYPMPTWNYRDCLSSSACSIPVGVCREDDGTCSCSDPRDVSIGAGVNATCRSVPEEDMTFISRPLKILGVALVAIQGVLSGGFALWTSLNRSKNVVRISQPFFLILVCLGTFVLAAAILPSGVEGEYRYLQNPLTGDLTGIPNLDIKGVDMACMAFPWLAGLGFVIVFSALFAKIWRVKKIFRNSERFSRKKVEVRDVLSVMIGMFAAECVVLLSWQLVDPLRWHRTVLESDGNGYPTKSVGQCASQHELAFLAPLLVFNGGCLVYALYLCYVTRNFPDEFASGKWITLSVASIFQIMLLAIPVLVIVQNDTNAFYFVRAAILFLMSSTVTLLIFGPMMYNLHVRTDELNGTSHLVRKAQDSVIFGGRGGSGGGGSRQISQENASMYLGGGPEGGVGATLGGAHSSASRLFDASVASNLHMADEENGQRGGHMSLSSLRSGAGASSGSLAGTGSVAEIRRRLASKRHIQQSQQQLQQQQQQQHMSIRGGHTAPASESLCTECRQRRFKDAGRRSSNRSSGSGNNSFGFGLHLSEASASLGGSARSLGVAEETEAGEDDDDGTDAPPPTPASTSTSSARLHQERVKKMAALRQSSSMKHHSASARRVSFVDDDAPEPPDESEYDDDEEEEDGDDDDDEERNRFLSLMHSDGSGGSNGKKDRGKRREGEGIQSASPEEKKAHDDDDDDDDDDMFFDNK